MADTTILALCGKGGVGKTSIAALMVKLLSERNDRKILAIDADPAVGLASALGMTVRKTVDDIRKELIGNIRKSASPGQLETLKSLDYEMLDALEEQGRFALLAIGRSEDEGCFCRINNLLKDIINDLADKFDIVLIDGEAGIEQINRRVMKTVDQLVLVSDTSAKGIGVANTIAHVAHEKKAVDFKSMGLVLNRVRTQAEVDGIRARTRIPIYGWIPEDDLVREYDYKGRSLTGMSGDSSMLSALAGMLERMVKPA
jgi:CO dehydrogenase maturation factor